MALSVYQQNVCNFASRMETSLVIQARAGSGKTTTIVEACKQLPANARIIFCAFNKSIAKELGERVPSHIETSTLHSLGFKLIRERFKKVRVDEYRTKDLVREIMLAKGYGIDGENGKPKAGIVFNIAKLAGLGKNLMVDTQAGLIELAYDFECAETEEAALRYAEIACLAMERCAVETSKIDFDDMIYLTWKLNLVRPIYDFVIIDEAQDMNAAQLHLAKGVCKGKMIVVGDDRQAIYGWRGADSEAMGRMVDELNATVLPLSVTYRCDKAIVEVAREVVPDLEAAPSAGEGQVASVPKEAVNEARPGDFVLSRKNAPLASLCLRFLAQGIPATIAGRDVGKALLALIAKTEAQTIDALATGIEAWREAEVTRFRALGKDKPERWEAKIQEVEDKAACILALMEGCNSLDGVIGRIESMFSDSTPTSKVVLSTVHKAKGLERDRVWILTETFKRGRNQEEDNLWYVAVTRAKHDLRLVSK